MCVMVDDAGLTMVVCLLILYWPSFFRLGVPVWWLLSLWPYFFFDCMPPKYFLPVKTLESCFALTSNQSHASLAIPSLKYLWFSFSQTAAASIWVGPFLGSWAKHGAFAMGKIVFQTFSCLSSSVIFGCLSSTGFRNPSGTFICMSGQTAPLMTMCNISLSIILAKALMLAQQTDVCVLQMHGRIWIL